MFFVKRISRYIKKRRNLAIAHQLQQHDEDKTIPERTFVLGFGAVVLFGIFVILGVSYARANVIKIPDNTMITPIALVFILIGLAIKLYSPVSTTSFAGVFLALFGTGWVLGASGLFGEGGLVIASILFIIFIIWLSALISPGRFKQSTLSQGRGPLDIFYAFGFYGVAVAFTVTVLPNIMTKIGIEKVSPSFWEQMTIIIIPFTVMAFWQKRMITGPITPDGLVDTGGDTFIIILAFRIQKRTGVKVSAGGNNIDIPDGVGINFSSTKGTTKLTFYDRHGKILDVLEVFKGTIYFDQNIKSDTGMYTTTDARELQIDNSDTRGYRFPLKPHDYLVFIGKFANGEDETQN